MAKQLESVPFTIRLAESSLNALDELAEKTDRSRNWLVTRAVEDYIALNAWQVARIETGLADAKAGRFASAEEVARVRAKFATSSDQAEKAESWHRS